MPPDHPVDRDRMPARLRTAPGVAPVAKTTDARPDPAELYAALDLGTNSCRMLIAQPKGAQLHVVDSFSKSVQLGNGLEQSMFSLRMRVNWSSGEAASLMLVRSIVHWREMAGYTGVNNLS